MSEEHSGEDISISEAAKVMSAAMREAVKKHSLFYLFQGGLMILGGIVALIYPLFSAASIILLLGWLLLEDSVGLSWLGVSPFISLRGLRILLHQAFELLPIAVRINPDSSGCRAKIHCPEQMGC